MCCLCLCYPVYNAMQVNLNLNSTEAWLLRKRLVHIYPAYLFPSQFEEIHILFILLKKTIYKVTFVYLINFNFTLLGFIKLDSIKRN